MKDGKCVMLGARDPQSGLWRVNLKKPKPEVKSARNHAHYTSNQKDVIHYMHGACFSPVKSTWIAAIKNGNISSWPGLTERAIEIHLSKSSATAKGHEPAKYESQINQNQGRVKLCQYRHIRGQWNQNQLHLCCSNRCRQNACGSNWTFSCGFQQKKQIHHGII
jgi:hypothetical protein